MNKDTQEQIALFRFKLISPVLVEPKRAQNKYFHEQAKKKHEFPHYGLRKVKVSTLKSWLKRYREKGFSGLKPKARNDKGRPRKLKEEAMAAIRGKCKAYPYFTIRMLYEELLKQELLGDPPISYNTVLRFTNQEQLMTKGQRKDVRKRFETEEVNQLWVCDFMHGPKVEIESSTKKAILCAIIDDHSRMIVGHAFSTQETISNLVMVFKDALLTFGMPLRFYVDNGPAFNADLLLKSCAQAGISLIHSKPYDAPSRGKIERFFRTVRERFISGVRGTVTLLELNHTFGLWINDQYHHKIHSGINQRPIDRYHASLSRVDIKRYSRSELDQIFLVRNDRMVNNDATISFKGRIYEVPAAYIRQRIEIRHPVDDDKDIYLYDNGACIGKLKLVNVKENACKFKPANSNTTFSFFKKKVLK